MKQKFRKYILERYKILFLMAMNELFLNTNLYKRFSLPKKPIYLGLFVKFK